jgi:predicted transport protein
MSNLKYVKFERVPLGKNTEYNEIWVQSRIAEDPTILGLGELILKDKERFQPKAGRLDILLQDPESDRRYEVEVQLGSTDESHIIRTIEYWDIERKRYPQYDHTAVIIAEDITSRFLNVISLFNGFIPLVAIQMHALRCGDQISLDCTKVLDQMVLGLEAEGEPPEIVVDRAYWENHATKETVELADRLLELIHAFAPSVQLNYTQYYIGLAQDGRTNNFTTFQPQKRALRLEVRLTKSEDVDKQISEKGLDLTGYTKWGSYQIRLCKADVKDQAAFLAELMKRAYEESLE